MNKHGYRVTFFRKSGELTDYTFDVAKPILVLLCYQSRKNHK